MTKEALKLALEALEEAQTYNDSAEKWDRNKKAIAAIREALAQPVQSASGKVTDAEVDRAWAIASTRDMMEYALQDFVANRIEALAQPVQEPVSAAEIQRLRFLVDSKNLDKLYRDLHLVEEICEFYAKCDLSVEALRDWVSERMDTPPLPVQRQPVMQPIVQDEKGIIRFKRNGLVDALYEHGVKTGLGLNELHCMDFTEADRQQFAQLIGYSVSGYGDLSYVTVEAYEAAERAAHNIGAKP